jgi:hypothetical protein
MEPDIQAYTAVMEEIRRRTEVVSALFGPHPRRPLAGAQPERVQPVHPGWLRRSLFKCRHVHSLFVSRGLGASAERFARVVLSRLRAGGNMYRATQVESMVLQVRMIAELIAFASLAANKQVFEENQRNFEKSWNLAKLMKDIQKLNPGFYPRPILEVPAKKPGITNDLVDVTSGFMEREELVEVHGRCGGVLHARNPYGDPIRYEDFEVLIPIWMEKIRVLLNSHVIQLFGNTRLYVVHMKEAHDDRVRVHTFEHVDA